jgi:hypothetical protein
MTTKVSILSQAFVLLGTKPVNDPQNNPIYAAVSDLYDSIYPKLLAEHPWRFASQLFALNLVNETPPIETRWTKIFQLPADLVRIWRTYPTCDYTIFQDKIYTTASSLTLEYVFQVDESKFPDYFTWLLVLTLARDCAMLVTQNATVKASFDKDAATQNAMAKFLDSQGIPGTTPRRDAVYSAHYGL